MAGVLAVGALGAGNDGSTAGAGRDGTPVAAGQDGTPVAAGQDGRLPAAVPTALVIDASRGRDGRELVDQRLRDLDADVRLPRTQTEARTNVRYFDALGYRVIVAGPEATAAAAATGVDALPTADLAQALAAAESEDGH